MRGEGKGVGGKGRRQKGREKRGQKVWFALGDNGYIRASDCTKPLYQLPASIW